MVKSVESSPKHLRGYYGRKGDTIIKLCMLSSIGRDNILIIEPCDVIFALEILQDNESMLGEIVKYMGSTQEGQTYAHVLEYIKKRGVVVRSQLTRNFAYKLKASVLDEILNTLVEAQEVVEKIDHSSSKKGVRTYTYTGDAHERNE